MILTNTSELSDLGELDLYLLSYAQLYWLWHSTWNAVIKLADELREKKVKIGFFSSTPQGGE